MATGSVLWKGCQGGRTKGIRGPAERVWRNGSDKCPNAEFAALPLSGRSGLAETRGYSRRTDRKAERRALRARRRTLASDVHHRDNALSFSTRSDAVSVGKERVSTCVHRVLEYHYKTKK